jgi:hypothetical protein
MKHQTFEAGEQVDVAGDTADLRRCLWLAKMNASSRRASLDSLATLCAAAGCDGEIPVARVRQLVSEPDAVVKAAVGVRWVQVASDVRRALRHWDDLPTRWLALRLRDQIPTLADAATAASLRLSPDEAKRARAALEALAASEGGTLEDFPATTVAIDPILRAASPATFGVVSMKSLENKRTLVRKVVRFVDPVTSGLRAASVAMLPSCWQQRLAIVEDQLKDHEKSVAAILRRLAGFCARQHIDPAGIDASLVEAFVAARVGDARAGLHREAWCGVPAVEWLRRARR